jgi:RNA polymerase sigma-70 factor (ECF subfamily)
LEDIPERAGRSSGKLSKICKKRRPVRAGQRRAKYGILAGLKAEVSELNSVFATTRWTLVRRAGESEDDGAARDALAELCRIYWRPIFLYICSRSYAVPEAQDLTQDFFLMVLERDLFGRADRDRGRFRSFLLGSLRYFLDHAQERSRADKRGGKIQFISWDAQTAPSQFWPSGRTQEALPPERLFDLRWATTVVEQALGRLHDECEQHGRLRVFEILSQHLVADRAEISYVELAKNLGVAETVVKKQLHNLRQRYRWLLRDEVAQTVENPADVEDEIRHLCAVLGTESK